MSKLVTNHNLRVGGRFRQGNSVAEITKLTDTEITIEVVEGLWAGIVQTDPIEKALKALVKGDTVYDETHLKQKMIKDLLNE